MAWDKKQRDALPIRENLLNLYMSKDIGESHYLSMTLIALTITTIIDFVSCCRDLKPNYHLNCFHYCYRTKKAVDYPRAGVK